MALVPFYLIVQELKHLYLDVGDMFLVPFSDLGDLNSHFAPLGTVPWNFLAWGCSHFFLLKLFYFAWKNQTLTG